MKKFFWILIFWQTSLAYCFADATALQQAISGEHRSTVHKARDQYRHPLQTLEFFGVKADMQVVEIWPGGAGWYTEILAPYLKNVGKLYAAHFPADSTVPYFQKNRQKFQDKINARLDIYGKVIITELHPPDRVTLAPDNSVDRVLTFRNVHNWIKSGQVASVFNAMYRVLKPGGILGVVEHRNNPGGTQDESAQSGYVTEAKVIEVAEQAGFILLDKSEINANPKDSRDHPKGVWTLPPTLRLKDKERAKYLAIGESDRMTLKFIK
jgi:predicted methyltransferase